MDDIDDYYAQEDEFEQQYQEELEIMQQYEDDIGPPEYISNKTRKGINFDDPQSVPKTLEPSIVAKRPAEEMSNVDEPPPAKKNRPNNFQSLPTDAELGVSFLDSPEFDNDKSCKTLPPNKMCGVTSLRFPKWNFLTINTEFNERLYVRLRNDTVLNFSNLEPKTRVSNSFRLIKEKVLTALATDKKLNFVKNAEDDCEMVQETSQLWVEQFKPKKYLDLLSDEGVNRALLTWVKSWDRIVFNRERIPKKVDHETVKPQFKGKLQIQEEKAGEVDEDGRPRYKVALLCGSPGVGKTTLAHVIASLAGYNVIEMNASDDRNVDSFKTRLESATEMQSVLHNRKPNCLILDEIDGAPVASIDFLVRFVNGKVTEKVKKGKKEKTVKLLKRPVVCICNEPYTPALRQLRQQAYVLSFPNTSSTKLAQRLLDICRHQGMKTDLSTLSLLCDKAQSDIRSCITTLHFFKTQKRLAFRSNDVKNASVGLKDMQKSLFNVWQEIFQKPLKKCQPGDAALVSDDCSYHPDNIKRLKHIVQLLSSSGDYEKLQQGVFENVLKMQFPWFRRAVAQGLEWFCLSDLLDASIRHGQNFMLMPYLPYCFAKWHFLYSTSAWPKITYPTASYENFIKETKCKQITSDVLRGLKPSLRVFYQRRSMLLDVLPLLPLVLAPPLRPVNTTLFNDREKADFNNLINILLDFNMNFVQQRAADGTYYYTIDPNFEEVVKFQCNAPKPQELPYNLKQVISREVVMERVRRNEAAGASSTPNVAKSTATMNAASSAATANDTNSADKANVPSHLVKLKPKIIPQETMQYKDFFGRIVQVQRPKTDDYGLDKNNYLKSRVWFNYKEGFNNAVKKDMTIADLL